MSNTVRPLSVGRSYREVEVPLRATPDTASLLHSGVRDHCRRLMRSVPASERTDETQALKEIIYRNGGLVFVRTLSALNRVSARSPLMHHRFGLCELVRADITRQASPLRLVVDEVDDAEDDSNSAFDKALRRYRMHPTVANWQGAREAGEQQLAATRLSLDLLAAQPPKSAA